MTVKIQKSKTKLQVKIESIIPNFCTNYYDYF